MKKADRESIIKFLLVDDEPSIIRTITEIIEHSGLNSEILQALDGDTAFLIAKEEQPDIILTDWEMPGKDGIELIIALKRESSTAEIPIIMVTGSMLTPNHLKLALDSGAVDYARKPIDEVELMARINSILLLTRYYKEKITAEQNAQLLLFENLEKAEKQLLTSSMHVVNKNNLLIQLKDRINEIISGGHDNPMEQLGSLEKLIDQCIDMDRDWEEFKQHFDSVHGGFFEKLVEMCPELTSYEKKLCAYYRINLATKEIASILNITQASAKKSRQRLRKKLNLSVDQDFVSFLENI